MMSRDAGKHKLTENSNSGKLINDNETISRALNLDRNPSKSSSLARNRSNSVDQTNAPNLKSKHLRDDQSTKDKKSFWNWKPLKALSQIRHRRFNCCFTLDVHTIEGLPSKLNFLSLSVHWKRRDGEVVTNSSKVIEGVAHFEEKLTHTCSVYGSRNGPHHSAKYEAKHFLLYATIVSNPKHDLGKHRVDLTRLLPLTLEELEDEKSSGSWTTTFKLSGEAKGALMNVSFGYVVLGDTLAPNNRNVLQLLDSKATTRSLAKSSKGNGNTSLRRVGSLPNEMQSSTSRSVEDVKIVHAVPPASISEFSDSVNTLYQKFDEESSDTSIDVKHQIEVHVDDEPIKKACCSPSHPSQEQKMEVLIDDEPMKMAQCSPSPPSEEHKYEVSPDEPEPVNLPGCSTSIPFEEHIVKETDNTQLHFAEKGLESLEETGDVDEDGEKIVLEHVVQSPELTIVNGNCGNTFHEQADSRRNEVTIHDCSSEGKDTCTKESLLEDLESVLSHVAELEKEGLETPEVRSESGDQEYQNAEKLSIVTPYLPSHSFEDLADSVADEFLSMLQMEEADVTFNSDTLQMEEADFPLNSDTLQMEESDVPYNSDTEPESPRERLLREFQKEAEASGCSLFGFDIDEDDAADYDYYAPTISGWEEFSEDSDSLPLDQTDYPKIRATVMEDMETQELMEEWGLYENAFQSSPPLNTHGFGSPIDLPPKVPSELPPLGEGLGSCIQTKTGGFLRSMNPILFQNSKIGGSLVMQVSSPIVVPAELGSGVTDVLQHLASSGLEKLSMEANKLMPLEDITGNAMQQIVCEAVPHLEASERQKSLQNEEKDCHTKSAGKKRVRAASGRKTKKFSSSSAADEADSEYVSLEDLAPLAMDKIEALSIEGLRIQSGMSDEEAPSNIMPQSSGESSTFDGKKLGFAGSMGLEGAVGLQLLNVKDNGPDSNDGDGLMGLSLKLDEWMKLDSGEVDEEQPSERTSKLLAAHHASSTDLNFLRGKQGKNSRRRCGLLGNNFTVALMVQLRDPLRDYEPVGTPMLALIQVERIFVPPKPKMYSTVSEVRDCRDEDDDQESGPKVEKMPEPNGEKIQQGVIPQYKISEVHVAGLKSEPGKKKLWGNAAQQQSGSRWLLANGMGKGNKNPFMKPRIATKSPMPAAITSKSGDTLWSISAQYHGSGAKWKELAALNPHIRNPNVILPNETIRLR